MNEFVKIINEDVLAGIEALSRRTLGYPPVREADHRGRISLKIIVLLSIVLAVSRLFHGPAQTNLLQHFVATFAILLAFYLALGGIFLAIPSLYNSLRRYAGLIYLSLFFAGVFYFASTLLVAAFTGKLGSFTTPLLNFFDDFVFPESWIGSWTLLFFEKIFPALVFASVATSIVTHLDKVKPRTNAWGKIATFVFTGIILYFSVFDRDGFFDGVALMLTKLKLWA